MSTELGGEVRDEAGNLIPDALVYAIYLGQQIFLVRTDNYGYFRVYNIGEGDYRVWAEKWGYAKSTETSITITAGVPTYVAFEIVSQLGVYLIPLALVGAAAIFFLIWYRRRR